MFNDNMVSASILMLAFFGAILCVLGRDYLIEGGFMQEGQSMVFYVIQTLSCTLQLYLGNPSAWVRTFVAELTASFQGIADNCFLDLFLVWTVR